MAEDEELPGEAGFVWGESYPQMIAVVFLRDAFNVRATLSPLFRNNAAAAVGCGFFEAGRFRSHEAPQNAQHVRELRLHNSK